MMRRGCLFTAKKSGSRNEVNEVFFDKARSWFDKAHSWALSGFIQPKYALPGQLGQIPLAISAEIPPFTAYRQALKAARWF
jgi:hypothetical protein